MRVRSSAPSRKPPLRAYGFRKRTLRFSACPRQEGRPSKVRQQRQHEGTDMQNIAEFRIIGRIGSTEIKEKVATLDVAANYGRKVGNDWEDDTHWNRVTCFGKNIERAAKMAKGDLVHVSGRVRQSRYDRDSQTVYSVDLIVDRMAVIAKNGRPAGDDRDED
jgi:single-strand DNA-binding protein